MVASFFLWRNCTFWVVFFHFAVIQCLNSQTHDCRLPTSLYISFHIYLDNWSDQVIIKLIFNVLPLLPSEKVWCVQMVHGDLAKKLSQLPGQYTCSLRLSFCNIMYISNKWMPAFCSLQTHHLSFIFLIFLVYTMFAQNVLHVNENWAVIFHKLLCVTHQWVILSVEMFMANIKK